MRLKLRQNDCSNSRSVNPPTPTCPSPVLEFFLILRLGGGQLCPELLLQWAMANAPPARMKLNCWNAYCVHVDPSKLTQHFKRYYAGRCWKQWPRLVTFCCLACCWCSLAFSDKILACQGVQRTNWANTHIYIPSISIYERASCKSGRAPVLCFDALLLERRHLGIGRLVEVTPCLLNVCGSGA